MKSRRTVACVLVLIMLISMAALSGCGAKPAPAQPVSVVVATDRHDPMDGTGNNLTAVLELIANDETAIRPQAVILGGDEVGTGPDEGSNGHPAFSTADVKAEINSVFGDETESILTFGSHDTMAQDGYGAFLSGPKDMGAYYVYGISYAQMVYATRAQAEEDGYAYLDAEDPNGICAEEAAAVFNSWARSLTDDKPILFISHVPMHINRADNLGAQIWSDTLNAAAEKHPVIAVFGHNHTTEELASESNPSKDPIRYLCTPGSRIGVQGADKTADYSGSPAEIRFIYINAGYIKLGYATLLTFTDKDQDGSYDSLIISRYGLDGNRDFGNTGFRSPIELALR